MKSKIINNELVYFTGKKERIKDFSGWESSFNTAERFDFLKHYQEAARKWYNDDALNEKACREEELEEFFASYKELPVPKLRKLIKFDTMEAYTAYKEPQYLGLHLYCGAYVDNDAIVFGRRTRPTPCAKIELPKAKYNINLSMLVYIPKEFKCTSDKQAGTAQPGRIIELRCGTLDIAKIKFFNTGEVFALSKDKWEPVFTNVGEIKFGAYNDLEISLGEKLTVTVNGHTTGEIERTNSGLCDNIFFDGGMFPHSEWRVRDIKIDGVPFSYVKNTKCEKITEAAKEVTLPFAIGCAENADRRIYLEKSFDVDEFENALLSIESLDPCGKVWLNGELVLDAPDFMSRKVDVTPWLKRGKNTLKIMVEPRPGEVYYYWHRHDDCYNGWFSGEVSIELTAKKYINDVKIFTRSVVSSVSGEAFVSLNADFSGTVKLYAKKFSPCEEEEIELCENYIKGKKTKLEFKKNLELWEPKNPVLYALRAVILDENGTPVDDFVLETGFRTIEQKNGKIYLNNKKEYLSGALLMQFLPPLCEVPINHNCPSDRQIAEQCIMLKNMNGNLMRLHLLGYGTNDKRFAEICDRLGIMMVWTTRLIDSLETLVWDEPWCESELFRKQIEDVINYPSIVMYEGSNEYHSHDLATLDRMHDEFVDLIDKVDTTRLISPISNVYYGDYYYYSCDGTRDNKGNTVRSGKGWMHPRVIRSLHVYNIHCGYGKPWEIMRKQPSAHVWDNINNPDFAVFAKEFAITGLPNPNTKEALENEYVESYERPDEIGGVGRIFTQEEWRESQGFQAFCAYNAAKDIRLQGFDGFTWCCLSSGANNGSYMKPPIDFYGYKKLGFYALRDVQREVFACKKDIYVSFGTEDGIAPAVVNYSEKGRFNLKVTVSSENGCVLDVFDYGAILLDGENKTGFSEFKPSWQKAGYYILSFSLEKLS